jgi:hypothetical protein
MQSHDKSEFFAPHCLYLAQVPDQFHGIAPMQASRQFSVQQTLMECRHLVMKALAHDAAPRRRAAWVE